MDSARTKNPVEEKIPESATTASIVPFWLGGDAASLSPITTSVKPASEAPGVPLNSMYSLKSMPGWSTRISLITGSTAKAFEPKAIEKESAQR